MNPAFAQAIPQPQRPGDPDYDVLLAAATAPVREALGERVQVEVERLDRMGRWAFLQGSLRAADGSRPSFEGTGYAERAAAGGMSDVYVALLAMRDGATEAAAESAATTDSAEVAAQRWELLDYAIGPGDVAWLVWPDRHAAPRALFGF